MERAACDDDDDNDGVSDGVDNCPLIANPNQSLPSNPSSCDQDFDSDGVQDSIDNCPVVNNSAQTNMDQDRCHRHRRADLDGDGVGNLLDNCPRIDNGDQSDLDRDGIGERCDPHTCFVISQATPTLCLDPTLPFTVLALPDSGPVGAPRRLRLFANREDVRIHYDWSLPAGHQRNAPERER